MGWARLLLCLAVIFVPSVADAETDINVSDVPFGVAYRITSDTPVRLKACFSFAERVETSADPTNLDCEGETWNGQIWLTQNDSWTDFPLTTSSGGKAEGIVAVRYGGERPFLHLIYLVDGKTSSSRKRVPTNYRLTRQVSNRTLTLRAFDDAGGQLQSGWMCAGSYIWPVINGEAQGRISQSEISLAYLPGVEATCLSARTYRFETETSYHITLNPPAPKKYNPKVAGPAQVAPNQNGEWRIITETPYPGSVAWYVDGILESTEAVFLDRLPQGDHEITARLTQTDETSPFAVVSQPYRFVRFEQLSPRPSEGLETISLKNIGNQTTSLVGWTIRSDRSGRVLKLNQTLEAGQTVTQATRNLFVNTGATYTLQNDSNEVVDTIEYPQVGLDDLVTRLSESIVWEVENPTIHSETVSLAGTVSRRAGQSLDIITDNDQPVHLITEIKLPSIHKNDRITLTNVVKTTSKKGVVWTVTEDTRVHVVTKAEKSRKVSRTRIKSPRTQELKPVKGRIGSPLIARSPPKPAALGSSRRYPVSLALLAGLGVVLIVPKKSPS